MRFSSSTGCFYPSSIAYPSPPADLIDCTQAEYDAAMARVPGATLTVAAGKLVIVPAPVPAATDLLANAQANGLTRIANYSKSKRAQIAGTTDDGEIAGWTYKLQIAQAIGAGTATVAEIAAFQAEIDARGIVGETMAIFCQKVLRNAAFYAQAVGLIDGVKRRAQDAVNAATTPDQVEAALAAAKLQAEAAFAALMQGAPA